MHPGPINRGVEMSAEVADGKNSVILEQLQRHSCEDGGAVFSDGIIKARV